MKLIILGTGSAIPTVNSNPTSQVLDLGNELYLIDCGEGSQVQLIKNKVKYSRINSIFISHLHGDHFFGLIGLISTYNLLGRTKKLTIFSPKGLKEIIELQLKYSEGELKFKINFEEIKDTTISQKILESEILEVYTIPLKHRIPTVGYLFKEKEKLSFCKDLIKKYNLSITQIKELKQKKVIVLKDGETLNVEKILDKTKKKKSYAFCSDTAYKQDITPIVKNVDLLYHETTFLEQEKEKAKKTLHSTTKQAGEIAKSANVKKLLIGHFSRKYKNRDEFLIETKEIFENTELAKDGEKYII